MGSRALNCCSVSLKSGRFSIVEGVRYALTSGVQVYPVTISQLTMFGLWKRLDSIPHPVGRSVVTKTMLH